MQAVYSGVYEDGNKAFSTALTAVQLQQAGQKPDAPAGGLHTTAQTACSAGKV
jgi:hypothetical protein